MKTRYALILVPLFMSIANAENNVSTNNSIPFFIYKIEEAKPTATASETIYNYTPRNSNNLRMNDQFETYKYTAEQNSMSYLPGTAIITSTYTKIVANLEKIAASKASDAIKMIRSTVCNAAGDADAKIWINFDADGKIGIGASAGAAAQSGIEITFHCKAKN